MFNAKFNRKNFFSRKQFMSEESLTNCICKNVSACPKENLVAEFAKIREKCAAINKILFPEKIWKYYQNFPIDGTGMAKHFPLSFIALQRGVLFRITLPIHHFLLTNTGEIKSNINKNYLSDLKEDWLIKKGKFRINELRRHERWKEYTGKLVELISAYWLQHTKGWKIKNLEAWKNQNNTNSYFPDIEAERQEGKICAIEVKFIGIENEMFMSLLDKKPRCYSDADIITFILCKMYETGKQMRKIGAYKIMFLVIDEISWPRIKYYWNEDSIDWTKVKLNKKSRFFAKFQQKHPNVENDLHEIIAVFSEVWIIVMTGKFLLEHKHTIRLPLKRKNSISNN